MDSKVEFDSLKNELIGLGFSEEKFYELLDLAIEEAIDIALNDLEENVDDSTMEQLSIDMDKQVNSKEEAMSQINMVFQKVYGTEAENKKLEFINQYLKETIELTKKSKDLAQRYMQGDPTAIAAIRSNMDNPNTKEVENLISE